jgi:hypothetical protein
MVVGLGGSEIHARLGLRDLVSCQAKSRQSLGAASSRVWPGLLDAETMATEDSQDESRARTAAQFATTHWSVVLAAGDRRGCREHRLTRYTSSLDIAAGPSINKCHSHE